MPTQLDKVVGHALSFRTLSIALILSAILDDLSTLYVWHSVGTSDVEANPVFRGLGWVTSGTMSPVVLLVAMKATCAGVLVLRLRLTLSRVPDLYPPLGRQHTFLQFANFFFCGVEVRGWRSLFLVPQVRRLYRGLSVPVVAIILGQCSVSVVNTFRLFPGFSNVVIFWVCVGVSGLIAGLEMLRRDFLTLSRSGNSQPTAAPTASPHQ